jgi:hypothetical protein
VSGSFDRITHMAVLKGLTSARLFAAVDVARKRALGQAPSTKNSGKWRAALGPLEPVACS